MPHCILEYSDNISEKPHIKELLTEINDFLANTGLFNKADIKSRAFCHDTYIVGDGEKDRAFASLNIHILSGRENEAKSRISNGALKILEKSLHLSITEKNCSITVQITDLHRESYARIGGRNR